MKLNPYVQSPYLSIVIPARNEANRLPSTLEKIAQYLANVDYLSEILVVDNGSTDGTSRVVRDFARCHPDLHVEVIFEPLAGKGAAVRTGMLNATGEILFLCDADLSMPIGELDKFLKQLSEGQDVAIGCREGAGSQRQGEYLHRRLMGRVFNVLLRSLGLTDFPDTQCGFKAFRKSVARDLFSSQTVRGWGFDVEILFVARLRRYTVYSIPIVWIHDADSRVRPFRDGLSMIREVIGIHKRIQMGFYRPATAARTTAVVTYEPVAFSPLREILRRAA